MRLCIVGATWPQVNKGSSGEKRRRWGWEEMSEEPGDKEK